MKNSLNVDFKAQTTVIQAMSSLKAQILRTKKTTWMNLKTRTMPGV